MINNLQRKRKDMNTKKVIGLIIYCLGALYMVAVGAGLGKFGASPAFHLSAEELSQTAWRLGSPLMMFWCLNGWLGPILAGVGILFYVQAKGVYIWLIGTGLCVIFIIDQVLLPGSFIFSINQLHIIFHECMGGLRENWRTLL